MTDQAATPPPFELMINVRTLSKKGQHIKYTAPEDTLAAVAKEHNLISVESFEATCLVAPWKRDGVQITGQIKANITQPCAVTAEPLKATVNEDVEVVLVPEGSRLAKPRTNEEGEWVFDVEGTETPEIFVGDSVDVASVWLEFFTIGIDPYARHEGAEFTTLDGESGEEEKPESPFAALAKLKKN